MIEVRTHRERESRWPEPEARRGLTGPVPGATCRRRFRARLRLTTPPNARG